MTLMEAKRYRAAIERGAQSMTTDDNYALEVSALFPTWAPGMHYAGERYNADGQTWECYADYDNTVYPGIAPGSSAWPTFNRPLHGTTPATARPFVQPTNALDIYRAGEYMILGSAIRFCIRDTSHSPDADPSAWAIYGG